MRMFLIALAVGALTTSAHAQVGNMGGGGLGGHHHQQRKNAKAAAPKPKVDEKAYSSALKELPDKPYDPWHGVH
jgi:hypothetical protein